MARPAIDGLFDHTVRIWRPTASTNNRLGVERRRYSAVILSTGCALNRNVSPEGDVGPGMMPIGRRRFYMRPDVDVRPRDVVEIRTGPDSGQFWEVDQPPTRPRGHHTQVDSIAWNGTASMLGAAVKGSGTFVAGASFAGLGSIENPPSLVRLTGTLDVVAPATFSGRGEARPFVYGIPNLAARYDADETFEALADGADILTGWNDIAGANHLPAVNAGGGQRPKIRKNARNGIAAVELFGGTGYSFAAAAAALRNQNATIFLVGRALDATATVGIAGHHSASGGAGAGWNMVNNGNWASFALAGYNTMGAFDLNWHILAIRSSTAIPSTRFYRDGVLGATVAAALTIAGHAIMSIGRFYGDTNGLQMKSQVAELTQWNRALTDDEFAGVIAHLKAKYAIA